MYLSVGRNDLVTVGDRLKHRILILDSNLELKKEIPLNEAKHGLRDPMAVLLDWSKGRMFVADNEWKNQRISIFDF